jgi:hypothetical protein
VRKSPKVTVLERPSRRPLEDLEKMGHGYRLIRRILGVEAMENKGRTKTWEIDGTHGKNLKH